MMLEKLVEKIVAASTKPRSVLYKAAAMLIGASLFAIIVPLLLLLASYGIEEYFLSHRFRILQIIAGLFGLSFGFFLVLWSVILLVRTGKGTPVPIAPPQKFIVDGPYRISRNPILLGAMLYYFGVGTIIDSIATGLLMFFLSLIVGTCYNKFIEEKELQRRFGTEYEEYRSKTPFLFPRWL
ncbi:MAG: isoprenylcysteine carboxylmethyltransferase family protein [Deltaproteobacteria bacterium]|nr:isoprenylcysteine carboxylmethyltransferase family protein [Deltaproteobacteria bacterium]